MRIPGITSSLPTNENGGGRSRAFDRAGWLALAGLTAIAVVMRFYRLGDVPAGLHYDEAYNGLDALALLNKPLTDWPIFFEGNSGREPLFIWLSGGIHAIFGPSVWAARSISALSGVLLIPALAWLGWEAAPMLDVRHRQLFALWSAAAALALLWSQIFARYGIRPALFVLLQALIWAALWRAWQREPPAFGAWTIAGLLAGLSFYTYLPARLLPLVLLPLLIAAFLQDKQRLRRHLPGLFAGGLGALLVAAPLALYFAQNPMMFSGRVGGVSLIERGEPVLPNLGAVLGMFTGSGDGDPRNNLPRRPALDPLLALPFLIGLGLALRRCWRLGRMFLLVGLGVLLLPTFLSNRAPQFLRASGALPFTALLIAYGAEGSLRLVGRLWRKMLWPAQTILWAVFAGAIALTGWTYFGVWATLPKTFYIWEAGFIQLVRQIADGDEATVYVSTHGTVYHPHPASPSHPAAAYLLRAEGATAEYHDGHSCMRVALNGSARYFFPVQQFSGNHLPIDSYLPASTPAAPVIFNQEGNPWFAQVRKAQDDPVVFPEMVPQKVELADGIDLNGYWLSEEGIQPGQAVSLRLFWRVNRTPAADYTTLIHLVQLQGDGSLARVTGFDRRPGDGSCPTTAWLPGEMVVDAAVLTMPEGLPEGDLFLAVGFYTLADGRRMPIRDYDNDEVLIGPLPRSP